MKKRKKKNLFIVMLIVAAINMMTGCGSLKAASDGGGENVSEANAGVSGAGGLDTGISEGNVSNMCAANQDTYRSAANQDTYRSAYETLMEYKAEDYSRQSIADLSALIDADYPKFSKAYNVVLQHILPDDENYGFVMLTLSASVAEIYYRNVEKSDVFSFGGCAKKLTQPVKPLPGEEEILAKNPVYDFLFFANYWINYTVPDSSLLTVAERDNALAAVSEEMQKYVDGLSENEILSGDIETMLADRASALSESLSTDNIKLSCEISRIEIYNEGEQEIINLISKDDYQKLQLLQFDGYEDMTVSDYQRKVWELTDTAEYRDLMERVSGNEAFYELKDAGKTASFLFYVMEPLTAEKWETRNYSGYADSGFAYPEDNAVLEYDFTLTILNADSLTVREYNDTRLNVIRGMDDILSGRSVIELQSANTSAMEDDIKTETDDIIKSLQNEKIGISIEYAYFPIPTPGIDKDNEYYGDNSSPQGSAAWKNDKQKGIQENGNDEQRRYSNATEEDYRSLLTLKKANYQKMTIADFNAEILEWMDEDYDRMERIGEDTACDDFQVSLNDEELSFIKLTVFLSGMENGKMIQSIHTGRPAESPCYSEELPQKISDEDSPNAAWCSLYYQFSYSISDKDTVTVGERDSQIQGMINAVRTFWNDSNIESVLKMNESDIVAELQRIAEAYSTDNIIITTNAEQVQFECMDEREYASIMQGFILPCCNL